MHVGHWVSTKFVAEMSTDSTTSIYFGSDPGNSSHKLPVEWTCLAMLRTYTHPHPTPRQKWKRPCLNMVMQNSDAELCRFFDLCLNKRSSKQSPLIWDAIALIMASLQWKTAARWWPRTAPSLMCLFLLSYLTYPENSIKSGHIFSSWYCTKPEKQTNN